MLAHGLADGLMLVLGLAGCLVLFSDFCSLLVIFLVGFPLQFLRLFPVLVVLAGVDLVLVHVLGRGVVLAQGLAVYQVLVCGLCKRPLRC